MQTLKEKQLYCILPTSAAEAMPIQACDLLGITMLAHFCSLGLRQTQTRSLFDTPIGSQHLLLFKSFLNVRNEACSLNPRSCLCTMWHLNEKTRKQVNDTRKSTLAT
jgi:hypothetical protein